MAANTNRTHVPTCGQSPVTPQTRAYIHLLRATNLSQQEIAERIGLSDSTVHRELVETRSRVEDGEDPVDVYMDALAPIHALDPPGGDG